MTDSTSSAGLVAPTATQTLHPREVLLGRVAALYLLGRLTETNGNVGATATASGTARFIVDCLSPEQTAAIAWAILEDPTLSQIFEIKLPVHFVGGYGLPETTLTDERATYFRNAPCDRPALLLANTGDDEEQSLRDLTPVGTPDLLAHPDLWVQVAGEGLPLTDEHRRWWERALLGLQDLRFATSDRYAAYVLRTREQIGTEGLPLLNALGAALPALRIPKDSFYFNGLAERVRTHASKWRALYAGAYNRRACYLSKQTPSGVVLNEDDLHSAFERVRGSIPEDDHEVVLNFIGAPGGWTAASARMADCEWESVKPLFDGLGRERFNLGKATLEFYEDRNPELLPDSEREYLTRLIARRTTEAEEEDLQFYESHRDELREDRKLKSTWDKFVFGTPKESFDFLAGLVACLEGLSWETPSTSRKLTISCESRYKKDFRDLNVEAGLFFAFRYRGFPELFGRAVKWRVGELFDFPILVESWNAKRQALNRSEARSALQLNFYVELEIETVTGATERYSNQFIWRFNPLWVASELASDWERLASHPLVRCQADREPTNSKGAAQSVDIWNVRTLMAAYDRDRGSFVAVYQAANDVALRWHDNLIEARTRGYVSDDISGRLALAFDAFASRYEAAVRDFKLRGVASPELECQLEAFGALLELVCAEAPGDRNRQLLLRPVLQLGTVAIGGGRPTAVVAPWHPLRMAAMTRKARRVADLTQRLLSTAEVYFGDQRLFFRDLQEELRHPHYPEVVLGWQGDQAELLGLTDAVGDYSLHESPVATDEGADDTNENPTESASRVVELVQRYLAFQPHERANLSVVLYDCDSSRLPLAVVDRLGALQQDDEDARCQVILRHRDSTQLRRLYEQIVESSDSDGDAFVASETTRDFMARLRIGIMADQAPPPDPRDGRPEDIVFSQDVIARHARLEWYAVATPPIDPALLNPAQWSRRRPASAGDMKSVTYLCCPAQRAEGWAYLSAAATFFKGNWNGDRARTLVPARQLDFQDPKTASIFEETHNLGTWVVNYDELLDRRQLSEQHVRIIRYKQVATQGRNLVISSRAPVGLLRSMVVRRLRDLHLELGEEELHSLADRFVADANDLSGDIVLRAAKHGRSASELMGVVLSRFVMRCDLGPEHYAGWYFLDDYADWLGQREEQIADLMALCPLPGVDGMMRLLVAIAEAKYIDAAALASKRKESQKQLRDTIRRVAGAVGDAPMRLDRDLWLARLSDLLVDGARFPLGTNLDLPEWRRAIRDGRCAVELRGYSHVFVSGPVDAPDCSEQVTIPDLGDPSYRAVQEIFGRERVRELVLRFHRGDVQGAENATAGDHSGGPAGARAHGQASPRPVPADGHPGAPQPEAVDIDQPQQTGQNGPSRWPVERAAPDTGLVDPAIKISVEVPTAREGDASSQHWAYPGIASWAHASEMRAEPDAEAEAWLRQTEATTRLALQQFQLQAKLLRSVLTPNAALLKFQGSANLTVEQVLRRRTEFLTTYGLKLIGVQPEPGAVSLSIARAHREIVPLQALWHRWTSSGKGGDQDLLIGVREDNGELLLLSPSHEHAPHTLIAGSTGSGKSVLMQNIILSIAATNLPSQARITLVDPKQGVDYFAFEELPHLDGGIIDRQDEALVRIRALVDEMNARYALMRRARAANVRMYNERVSPAERLPTLWLIHDEFAEWMLTEEYKQEVASAVQRLGVKARAAGIHLVFAAQRPEANVMPMQLRANLGNRLILRVDSEGTSEIALGEKGAERLLGRGHLLAKLEGMPSLVYAQVPYATPDEIDELVQVIRGDVA
jgi:S-DNA-T family DNA segregation ATPase FtsK/SpoIIIE